MGIHDREHLEVLEAEQLLNWLKKHHATSPGLWVVTHKKASGVRSPSYDEIVRAVLRYGWIDSIPGKVDELRSKLYVSPRKPNSAWSQANKTRIQELTSKGLMFAAGLEAVDAAKKAGTWNAIDSAQNLEIPNDLLKAFKGHKSSKTNFEAFPNGVKKQILEWIAQAKTPQTREKRVSETASLAAKNIRANQWRDKKRN